MQRDTATKRVSQQVKAWDASLEQCMTQQGNTVIEAWTVDLDITAAAMSREIDRNTVVVLTQERQQLAPIMAAAEKTVQ
ncbi:hypothetical protein GCM10011520_22570 [Shewanella carassii]|uniref:Uncharacterized protein n=1 Tax=Shewanella carassii TaxID=1987584 RepID=A0ABQ1T6V3_9GAMM|nr:hypothetical protein GCM10011520_22570 [Shewanella carassii]